MELNSKYVGMSFAGENLSGHILSGTFIGVSFSEANLQGAKLSGEFIRVNFSHADLTDASLDAGHFVLPNFSQAILRSTAEE